MGLVQAKMSFYHDSIGTRAHNEIFEIQNEQLCAELEQMGYVTKVSQEQEQAHQECKAKEQEIGQKNAKANEAVSLANHEHNVYANQHTENIKQFRQQKQQQQQKQPMHEAEQAKQRAEAQAKAARKTDK